MPHHTWACRCHLGAGRGGLGEPSTVAHSAMLLLALASWEGHPKPAQRRRLMAELAAGLLRQQRGDGSFAVHFDPPGLPDSGWQLYGGEAAYALAAAGAALDDARLLGAAERALEAYRRRYTGLTGWLGVPGGRAPLWSSDCHVGCGGEEGGRQLAPHLAQLVACAFLPFLRQGEVEAEERAFFANWQCQAGAAVHRQLPPGRERRQLAAYMHGLQGGIIGSGYYQDVREVGRVGGRRAGTWDTAHPNASRCVLPATPDPLLTRLPAPHAGGRPRSSRRRWRWRARWRGWPTAWL